MSEARTQPADSSPVARHGISPPSSPHRSGKPDRGMLEPQSRQRPLKSIRSDLHPARPRRDHRRDEAGSVDEVSDYDVEDFRRRLSASLCASSSSPSPSLPSSPCCPP